MWVISGSVFLAQCLVVYLHPIWDASSSKRAVYVVWPFPLFCVQIVSDLRILQFLMGLEVIFSFIRHLSMVVVRLSGYVVVAGSTMLQEFMWILGQFGGV